MKFIRKSSVEFHSNHNVELTYLSCLLIRLVEGKSGKVGERVKWLFRWFLDEKRSLQWVDHDLPNCGPNCGRRVEMFSLGSGRSDFKACRLWSGEPPRAPSGDWEPPPKPPSGSDWEPPRPPRPPSGSNWDVPRLLAGSDWELASGLLKELPNKLSSCAETE